ncbi:hypothetical protein Droror1_Dr00016242 [Drosera rotundifolia]
MLASDFDNSGNGISAKNNGVEVKRNQQALATTEGITAPTPVAAGEGGDETGASRVVGGGEVVDRRRRRGELGPLTGEWVGPRRSRKKGKNGLGCGRRARWAA